MKNKKDILQNSQVSSIASDDGSTDEASPNDRFVSLRTDSSGVSVSHSANQSDGRLSHGQEVALRVGAASLLLAGIGITGVKYMNANPVQTYAQSNKSNNKGGNKNTNTHSNSSGKNSKGNKNNKNSKSGKGKKKGSKSSSSSDDGSDSDDNGSDNDALAQVAQDVVENQGGSTSASHADAANKASNKASGAKALLNSDEDRQSHDASKYGDFNPRTEKDASEANSDYDKKINNDVGRDYHEAHIGGTGHKAWNWTKYGFAKTNQEATRLGGGKAPIFGR